MSHNIKHNLRECRNSNLNQSLSSSAILESQEIGEKYEKMKVELFKERSRNRETIEDLHEVRRQYRLYYIDYII